MSAVRKEYYKDFSSSRGEKCVTLARVIYSTAYRQAGIIKGLYIQEV